MELRQAKKDLNTFWTRLGKAAYNLVEAGEQAGALETLLDKVATYKERIRALHERGICVMAGFIAGFDGDTPESIEAMARQLYETGVDVPFLSVLTPYRGTPAYDRLEKDGRILTSRGWEFYNGYNVAFQPRGMSPERLLEAHRALWREAFSLKYSLLRVLRSAGRLRLGAFLMCAMMNGFYCLKRLRGNEPIAFEPPPEGSTPVERSRSIRELLRIAG